MRSEYLSKIAEEWGVPYWDAYAIIMYTPTHRAHRAALKKLKGKIDESNIRKTSKIG